MASDLGTMMFPVTWSRYLTLTMGNHISHMECLDPVQTLIMTDFIITLELRLWNIQLKNHIETVSANILELHLRNMNRDLQHQLEINSIGNGEAGNLLEAVLAKDRNVTVVVKDILAMRKIFLKAKILVEDVLKTVNTPGSLKELGLQRTVELGLSLGDLPRSLVSEVVQWPRTRQQLLKDKQKLLMNAVRQIYQIVSG